MDNDSPELDAILDQILPGGDAPPAAEESAPAEAPASAAAGDASVEATPSPTAAPVSTEAPGTPVDPTPSPDLAAELAAIKAQLAETQQKAAIVDQLRAIHEQRQREAAEEQQRAAWQERIDRLVDLSPELATMERQRIVREIEEHQRSQYAPQIAERETTAEEAAKVATATILLAQKYLTPEQFQAFQSEHAFMRQFATPDAMQQQITRDRELEQRAYERAKAEFLKQQEEATAALAQQRIASGADLVGAGAAGSPATGGSGDPYDDMLDQIFPRR